MIRVPPPVLPPAMPFGCMHADIARLLFCVCLSVCLSACLPGFLPACLMLLRRALQTVHNFAHMCVQCTCTS
jgi:hypothetical protein